MDHKYNINYFLNNSFFATLNYINNYKEPISKLMIFTHNLEGSFYLFSYESYSNFSSLKNEQKVSLLIYKEEDVLDYICHLNLFGKALLISSSDKDELKLAYDHISNKSPYISSFYEFDNNFDRCTVIKVSVDSMVFTNFQDMKNSVSPVLLTKKQID